MPSLFIKFPYCIFKNLCIDPSLLWSSMPELWVSPLFPERVMHILCKERIILPPPFHEVLSREDDYGWCWCTIGTDEFKDRNMILAGWWNSFGWFACCRYNNLLVRRDIQRAPHFITIVDVFGKNVVMGQCHLQKFKVVADCSWIQSTCMLLLHYTTGFCPNPVFEVCNKMLCPVLVTAGNRLCHMSRLSRLCDGF